MLAPTHFVKVDQGILPVADCLHIDLIKELGVLILLNSYTGIVMIQQGGMERHLSCKHCPKRMKSHADVSMMEHTNEGSMFQKFNSKFLFYFVHVHVLWSTNLGVQIWFIYITYI